MMPMTRAMLAAVLLIYVVGAYLFRHYKRARVVSGIQAEINGLSPDRDYGRVRERNPAVRMGSLPALKALDESRSPDGDGQSRTAMRVATVNHTAAYVGKADSDGVPRLSASVEGNGANTATRAGSEPADSHTNLVPFERGYAFNFSRRIR